MRRSQLRGGALTQLFGQMGRMDSAIASVGAIALGSVMLLVGGRKR